MNSQQQVGSNQEPIIEIGDYLVDVYNDEWRVTNNDIATSTVIVERIRDKIIDFVHMDKLTRSLDRDWIKLKKYKIKKECECGKDKHGFASHSDWCPKFVGG